ncbi:hypothetical protein IMX07_15370 [bacterium]|nr:hypothetical protein [bacterium]
MEPIERRMNQKREQHRPRDRREKRFDYLIKLPRDDRKKAKKEDLDNSFLVHFTAAAGAGSLTDARIAVARLPIAPRSRLIGMPDADGGGRKKIA